MLIEDNGKGISVEYFEKVFDFFFIIKKVGDGVGLGLFVVCEIIEEYYGKIKFCLIEGVGM